MTLPLVLVSAWNDSGGGFTHRLLDGHPDFFCWPFELQLGTAQSADGFEGWFHLKYRWPVFPNLSAAPEQLFNAIIEDELKGNLTMGDQSKFAAFDVDADMGAWRTEFKKRLPEKRTRATVIEAYIKSFFAIWKNRTASNTERFYLGHCPIIAMDTDVILADFPKTKILHIVRSPFAGIGDMRARRPEVTAESYSAKWSLVNSWAVAWARKKPENFRIVYFSDLLHRREQTMKGICEWLGIAYQPSLLTPSWNGQPIDRMGPFGGVPEISEEHENECIRVLNANDFEIVSRETCAVRNLLGIGAPGASLSTLLM